MPLSRQSTPSHRMLTWPVDNPSGLATRMRMLPEGRDRVASKDNQADGRHGAIVNLSATSRRPSISSTASRQVQAAAPVYQLQPPRPTWGGVPATSAANT
jgi:hypothetical protein